MVDKKKKKVVVLSEMPASSHVSDGGDLGAVSDAVVGSGGGGGGSVDVSDVSVLGDDEFVRVCVVFRGVEVKRIDGLSFFLSVEEFVRDAVREKLEGYEG